MNSVKNDILKDQKLLTRFILKLRFLSDTPSLIQFVADDEDYMRLCRRIVNASAGDARVPRQFTEICRKHGLDFQVLKEKLTPVALALGLAVSSEKQSNYYKLLGISSDARKGDIKKAFRQKVRQVHPDTSGQMADSGQDFIHLKAAYQILSDPVLRRQYDETLPDENLWQEKGHQPVSQKRPGRTVITALIKNKFKSRRR
jgi:DnaJ-domain-containing protein 1